jgi:hypothetical protein
MEGVQACPVCGDAIGVYEAVVVIGDGTPRTTSLAREPELESGERPIVHRSCASRAGILEQLVSE